MGMGDETKERSVREGRGVDVGVIGLMGCESRKEVTKGGGHRREMGEEQRGEAEGTVFAVLGSKARAQQVNALLLAGWADSGQAQALVSTRECSGEHGKLGVH